MTKPNIALSLSLSITPLLFIKSKKDIYCGCLLLHICQKEHDIPSDQGLKIFFWIFSKTHTLHISLRNLKSPRRYPDVFFSWTRLNFLFPLLLKENSFPANNVKKWLYCLTKLVKCSVGGKRALIIRKRKTAIFKIAERKQLRRRNTNPCEGRHLLSGFAQLSFSHSPSALRSTLKTFGLPSESVLYDVPSVSPLTKLVS